MLNQVFGYSVCTFRHTTVAFHSSLIYGYDVLAVTLGDRPRSVHYNFKPLWALLWCILCGGRF